MASSVSLSSWRSAATGARLSRVRPSSAVPIIPMRAFSLSVTRLAVSEPPSQPKHTVLEKPTRFVPPSHGARLARKNLPKHYGPAFTPDEIKEQNNRDYPTMLPPEGTFAHWFWTSKAVHSWIAIGTLTVLGVTSILMNFSQTSPFKELIPPSSELFTDPTHFIFAWVHVIQLHHADSNQKAIDSRFTRLDDAMKRKMYQRAHGIEQESPITKIFGKIPEPEDQVEAEKLTMAKLEEKTKQAIVDAAGGPVETPIIPTSEPTQPRKKWFGLF
ncbi:hypothetical protein CFIMG_000106RA [Ceratocystis fimbriata CBS 114723]|uniref:Uncharacterized protein n=1 Tax=Ceratocystis fimbriata CBS 114723 TaxID=1035309 RepID=A0A2C5XFB0_9PEZI|nr:hypothetical protein CFIMG_000106RA [Ceratocystis fimbriata CBS 114723]